MFDTTQSKEIAKVWLAEFADAIASGDSKVVAQTFLPDGWLRDVLTFTWDLRALEGRDKISAYLTDTLAPANVTNIALDQTPHLGPETEMFSPKEGHGISFAFTYETRVARGRGYARLMPDTVDSKWKGWAVCMMVEDLKGYEEQGYESGIWEGHTAAWCDVLAGRHADVEKDPFVLVGKYLLRINAMRSNHSYLGNCYFCSWCRSDWLDGRGEAETDGRFHSHCREITSSWRCLEESIPNACPSYPQTTSPK